MPTTPFPARPVASPGRILFADDDDLFRQGLAARLTRAGFECVCTPNATGAAALLRGAEFDVLLSDIFMPGNVNLELIREIPQIVAGLPVILLTGHPTLETAIQSANLAVAGYLVKPPDWESLLILLRRTVDTARCCRKLVSNRQRLDQWSHDLAQLERNLRTPDGGANAAPVSQYLQILAEQLQSTLNDFEQSLALLSAARPGVTEAPSGDILAALERTVTALEQTRQNFKSKRLGHLRQELELLLEQARSKSL